MRKYKRQLILSAALHVVIASAVPAQESPVIVVSGAKIEENREDAVERIEVISSEALAESGAKTLTEALKSVPGVIVTGATAANPTDSVSMQGFDSEYVKILIDGVAAAGDISGAAAAFAIPTEDIERIEIIRGASSALYGSDAMGGVINIITKKPEPAEAGKIAVQGSLVQEITTNFTSNVRSYTGASISVAGSRASGAVTASFDWTKGQNGRYFEPLVADTIEYYLTPHKRLSFVRGMFDYRFDNASIGVQARFSDSLHKSNYTAQGFDRSAAMTYFSDSADAGIIAELEVGESLVFSGFSTVKYFFLNIDYPQFTVTGDIPSFRADNQLTHALDWETEARAAWDPNLYNSLLFGLNTNLQTIRGDSFGEQLKKQLMLSLFAQDTIALFDERFSIVPGLRADLSPPIDGSALFWQLTPKLSLRYDPHETSHLRLSYGMGYKVPSLKQKYWIFYHPFGSGEGNFILDGNPNLKPETSQSLNLSVEQDLFEVLTLSASGYFNYLSNMIDSYVYDALSDPQRRSYRNVNEAMTFGAEASVRIHTERFDLSAGYAYTGAVELASRDGNRVYDPLTLRVPHRVSLDMGYLIPLIETRLALAGEWNAPQLIDRIDNTYSPDYLFVSLRASRQFFSGKFTVYARAENILNNIHFIKGTGNETQQSYFGLNDGPTFTLGARLSL